MLAIEPPRRSVKLDITEECQLESVQSRIQCPEQTKTGSEEGRRGRLVLVEVQKVVGWTCLE
jgi:hypothetical protein